MVILVWRWLTGSMLAAILCCCAGTAGAWNASGHMQIGLSAFDRLAPDTQDRIVAALRQHPRYRLDFLALMPHSIRESSDTTRRRWLVAFAGTWPDVARRFAHVAGRKQREQLVAKYNRPRWHYINRPVYLTSDDRKTLAPENPPEPIHWRNGLPPSRLNLLQALDYLLQASLDKQTSAPQRGLFLSWILHLVADLHQPLHDASLYDSYLFPKGDKGGAELLVNDATTLHWLWDSALGSESAFSRLPPIPGRSLLPAQSEGSPLAVETIDLWSQAAHDLAATDVYTPALRNQIASAEKAPVKIQVTTHYRDRMRQLALTQAQLATERLERVLRCLRAQGYSDLCVTQQRPQKPAG